MSIPLREIGSVLAEIPTPPDTMPTAGGLQFKDAAPLVCGIVDNGVCSDDPRVLVRVNEATKIILDYMIPVGGMLSADITAAQGVIVLPPQMENAVEAFPKDDGARVRGDADIRQGWYEITNNSAYLDPAQHHDNPMVDKGLWPAPWSGYEGQLVRIYTYPGLQPPDAVVTVTGVKRFIPLTNDEDYLLVQNIEAVKCIILSVERYENNDPDGAQKYRQSGFELLQSEIKKHILDPVNYMRRKSAYVDDIAFYPENTLGWVRGNIAIDLDMALRTGKTDLTWSINQVERRLMKPRIWKDCIIEVQANVVGGYVYFPLQVQSVLAIDLNGCPIPIRSQFFEHLDNGPGMFSAHAMLKDMGDEFFPATTTTRRKYKLVANCTEGSCINAICKLRWVPKKPADMMTIKNYEAIRLAMTAKFLEEQQNWQVSQANMQQAFQLLEDELREYLSGIRHTAHVQAYGFGLGDVGGYWSK
jgi:hypothetical protein